MANVRKTITLTIDGQQVTAADGTRVIEAAKKLGIDIPHYCYHPSLSVAGSCRLCLVEVEGMPNLALACDTKVHEGMIVRTNTAKVAHARQDMLEFLLLNHPLDCPVCDRGGECILQWYAMDYGSASTRTTEPRRRFRKPRFDPLIELERNRCVLCSRCVRFLDEIAGEHVLGVFQRGNSAHIGTFEDRPIRTIFSGMIIDYCPVGSLTSKPFRFKARAWELQQVQSTCPYCAAGCPVTLWMRGGAIHRVTSPTRPGPENRINFHLDYDSRAIICNQGRFGCDFANSADRLKRPRLRRGDEMVEMGWDEALDEAARRLEQVRATHGPEAIGLIASSRATCEEMYLLQRFARQAIGTNNVDWRVESASDGAARAVSLALGHSTGQLDEPDRYEVILAIQTDLLAQVPVLALKLKEAARLGLSKVYILDHHLDGWVTRHAQGVVHYPIEAAERVLEGLERRSLVGLRPLLASGQDALDDLILTLRRAQSGLIVFGLDGCSGLFTDRWVRRIAKLAESLGEGWETLAVVPERNAVGAFLVGCQPDRLPGGWADDAAQRARVKQRWGSLPPMATGLSAPKMIEAARDGRLKALYVMGAGDFCAHPWLDSILWALGGLELLIVHDVFESPLSERADLVLPGALFFEKEGTLVDAAGWPQRLSKGWPRPFGIQDDAAVLDVLAQKMGKEFGYGDIGEVFEEMVQLVNPVCPMKNGDLCAEGPGGESPIRCLNMPRARARIQEGKFYSICPTYVPSCRLVPGAQPRSTWPPTRRETMRRSPSQLRLVWSRVLRAADAFGDRSEVMAPLCDPAWVELHPNDAARLGVAEGDMVAVESEDGVSASGQVRVTPHIAPGLVYVPENGSALRFSEQPSDLPTVTVRKTKR